MTTLVCTCGDFIMEIAGEAPVEFSHCSPDCQKLDLEHLDFTHDVEDETEDSLMNGHGSLYEDCIAYDDNDDYYSQFIDYCYMCGNSLDDACEGEEFVCHACREVWS